MSVELEPQPDPLSNVPGRSLPYIMYGLMLLAGLSLLALIFIPGDVWSSSNSKLTGVAILKPGLDRAIGCTGAGCMLVMLLASAACWNRKPRWQACACLAIGLLAFPAAAVHRIGNSLAPCIVCSTCLGPDGQTYAFMDSSFMQGQTLALGRAVTDSPLYKNFDILGVTNGDSPRSYILLARPTDKVQAFYGQLHLANGDTLLGIRYDNKCYFAYRFSTKRFLGHEDVESISPFLLVEPDSRLHGADVKTLLASPDKQPKGQPCEQALLDAAGHANAEVRQLAAQLLERRRED